MLKDIIAEKIEEKTRLDRYLASQEMNLSRSMIQKILQEEKVMVNGKKEKASYRVQEGDKIQIEIDDPKEVKLEAQEIPFEVIYEDNDILVVNKPKGLVVHPGSGNWEGTLVNAIMAYCKDSLSGIGGN